MAFTLHWANTYNQRYPRDERSYHVALKFDSYTDRLFPFTPPLSLQADVLYPNAEASVWNQPPNDQPESPQIPGCVGNQLDNPFPLESRTPVTLPLSMYPTEATGRDSCSLPVLNWETYMTGVHNSGFKLKPPVPRRAKSESEVTVKLETDQSPVTSTTSWKRSKDGMKPKWKEMQQLLIGKSQDLEILEQEPGKRKENSKAVKIKPVTKLPVIMSRPGTSGGLPNATVEKYTNPPGLKIKGTWNYFYNGTGSCDWIHDKRLPDVKHLFVGNGTKLRMISLKPSEPTQMLSYCIDSVWEEDQIPSNVDSGHPDPDDGLSSQIFQIKTLRRRNQVGVRRGKSIEIYIADGIPSLVASIPNVGYGFAKYGGLKRHKAQKPSPLLTSFDLNPHFSSQLVTIDENGVIQFIDVNEGKVTGQVQGIKSVYHQPDSLLSGGHGPQNVLNDANGVCYTGGHPEVIYYWAESSIYLHDGRMKPVPTHQLFNLRSSVSALSISDQELFRSPKNVINEVMSAFTPSGNPLYYYFGTTDRIFMMDVRVPRNPVIKLSHGLVSPPAFLDSVKNEDFEVLVGGSQRSSETFCALFETGHVACLERQDCQKRNPILHSYPRHLSNPREFADFAHQEGFSCQWEADFQRAQAHCDAWTTGLCLMKTSRGTRTQSLPPSFILFNSNAFGDVFMQEWEQKPILARRKTEAKDARLESFLGQWRSSMETPLDDVGQHGSPPSLTSDFSLFLQRSAERVKECKTLRTKPFDPFTPHALVSHRVRDGLPSLEAQIQQLWPVKSERAQRLLDVWMDHEGVGVDTDQMSMDLDTATSVLVPGDMGSAEGAVEIKEEVEDSYEEMLHD